MNIVQQFIARADVDVHSKDEIDRTPFFYAAGSGSEEVVNALLAIPGVDILSKDKNGRTPFLMPHLENMS